MQRLGPLKSVDSWPHQLSIVENAIKQAMRSDRKLEILEAGCGQKWQIDLGNIAYTLTGVDLDEAALKIRKDVYADLDEAVTGDLRTLDFEGRQFDVIYNAYVLEHASGAEKIMENFVRLDW